MLESTISSLYEVGYAATSTAIIAQQAGISRGALLHHFPTKVDLVLALIEHVVEWQREFYVEALKAYPKGRERFIAMTELTWRAWSEPSGIAIIEIMVAARSDRVLGTRLPHLFEIIEASQLSEMRTLGRLAGITDDASVETFTQLSAAAIRGLAIDQMFRREIDSVNRSMALLRQLKTIYTDLLLGSQPAGSDLGIQD